jgi:DNA-binding MarR family transcriptional regulator
MLGHYIRRGLDQELAQYGGASSAHFIVLMMLACEGSITAAELAKRLSQDPGAMTRLLDRMEARSLVRRVRQEDDRRRVCIELTSQGQKLLPVLERAGKVVVNRALRDFTGPEQRQLSAFLKRMIRNVQ